MRSLSTLALLFVATPVLAGDWPMFRGPTTNGLSDEQKLPLEWGREQNIKWSVALPAKGNSSPTVAAGRVFVTYTEDNGRKRSLACFDRQNGKQRWVRTVEFDKQMPTHNTNPHGSPSPACDGKRVVVWHSSAGLYCYDLEGKQLWQRELGEFRHIWGSGASPILYEGRVILHCGPGERVFVTALDLETGKTLWETEEPQEGNGSKNEAGKWMGSWCTPLIASVGGQPQIICSHATRVCGYDPKTGKRLWWCEGVRGKKGDLVYSSPIVVGDICFITCGFGGPSFAFKLGGTGDITASRLWRKESNPQCIGSGVAHDGKVYMAYAGPGLLKCVDPSTGEEMWVERGQAGNHWGSIVSAGGRLYVTGQSGGTIVFKPTPAGFESVALNQLGESSNSTPAISDGQIFLRTFEHLYCIGE